MKTQAKDRLLLIDLIKIFAILAIVYSHLPYRILGSWDIWIKITDKFYIGYGYIGVALFIFASGYGLSVRNFESNKDTIEFYKKRLIRIYPAFLMAIILDAILTYPGCKELSFVDSLKIISGFQCEFGILNGINRAHWFIGTIIILYLAYPIVNRYIKKNSEVTLLVSITLSSFFVICLSTANLPSNDDLQNMWYWCPVCWLAYFTFGIYLSKIDILPRIRSFKSSIFLSEFTFYIYLVHARLAWNPEISSNTLFFISATIFLSMMLYSSDKWIQKSFWKKLKKNN